MASKDDATENLKERGLEQKLAAMLAEYNMLREEMRLFGSFHRRDSQMMVGVMILLVGLYVSDKTIIDINVLTLIYSFLGVYLSYPANF